MSKEETGGRGGALCYQARAGLRVLDGVFAFLQLGDVQLRLGAVQPLEPHLVAVDVGDDGAARARNTNTAVV